MGYGLDRSGSAQGQLAGTCECGNEAWDSIKIGEFLDWLKTGQLLPKDSAPWSKYNNNNNNVESFCETFWSSATVQRRPH